MTQYVLSAGSTFSTTPAAGSQNIQWNCPTNPILKNDLSAAASVVCYEIHNDNSALTDPASTNGVSYSNTYSTLNRIYPNNTTVASYLENLENTPGYRIKCHIANPATGQSVSGLDLTTNDYFVMIFADDYKKHHFARINEITKDDITGDSFEIEPAYNGEISKGTNFAIYKGPLLTDTSVVALMYGGQGSGSGSDSRHDIYTNCVRPLFYFYNDRLDKDNQLDHNTKYSLYYSRWDGSSEVVAITHFVTEPDYGLQVIDYGPYTTTALLVDNNRANDTPSASSGGVELYGSSTTSYTNTYTAWNSCFKNIQRTTDNKIAAQTSGSFTGPKRYIHYSDSTIKNNMIPRVMDISLFQSITKTGSYFEGKIIDPHKIMGLKIKKYDPVKVRQKIIEDNLSNNFEASLFGTYSGTSGANTITATALSTNQDLRIILKNSSGEFELIKIGDYYYKLSAIAAPAVNTSTNALEQVLTISHHRKFDAATFTSGNLAVTFTGSTAKRQRWGKVTETLLVDFNIDTVVTHANADSREVAASAISYNGTALSSYSDSRINGLELVLIGNEYSGHRINIKYGDSVNGYVKLDTPRVTIYQKESLDYPNMLDYFSGSFYVDKILFDGIVENIEENVENGVFFYKIYGRNNIKKLLGPTVNKDYMYSEDWIYSTQMPLVTGASSIARANGITNLGDTTITVDFDATATCAVGDIIAMAQGSNGYALIGRITNVASTVLTLEEGSLIKIPDNQYLSKIGNNSDYQTISLGKAIQGNSSASSTVTTLRGAANKGLIFNSGLKLTKSSGIPTTDGATLQGTSAFSHPKARGYYLHDVQGIDGDLPFSARLTDELSSSLSYSEVHTINSLTNFEIVSVDSQEGESIIELAPNCPAVLARVDDNPEDVRFRTFTATGLFATGSVSVGNVNPISVDYNGGAAVNAHGTIPRGTDLYKYDGTLGYLYIGKVERIEALTYTGASASATPGAGVLTYTMIFKEPTKAPLVDGTPFYISDKKNNHLYFLNTQGMGLGGFTHFVNPVLSSARKPITFSYQENSTIEGNIVESGTGVTNYGQYGQPIYRYFNLQKGKLGSIYFMLKRLSSGANKSIYSRNRGNANAYAYAYKSGSTTISYDNNDYDARNTVEKTRQFKHESRGIFPANGSAYEDYEIRGNDSLPGLYRMARYDSDGGNGDQDGPWDWDNTNIQDSLYGYKSNAIAQMRDRWENIDPKMIRWFIFANGDIWPDSMTRQHNLGYSARDLTDYSLVIKGETTKESSGVIHSTYLGSLPRETIIDSSFETLSIKSASISGNQMKRVGLMRLKELTFDWHFNLLDTELPPDFRKDAVGYFPYARFLTVEPTSTFSAYSKDVEIVSVVNYTNSARTQITLTAHGDGTLGNENSNGGGVVVFAADDEVYTSDGRWLGTVDSSNTTTINLKAAVKLIDGALYVGKLYKLVYDDNSNSNPSWRKTNVSGRAGEDSLWDLDKPNTKPLMPTQGAIIRGAHPNSGQTSANWDANWGSSRDLSINGIIMPPVFTTGSVTDFLSPLNVTQKVIDTSVAQQQTAIHPSGLMNDLIYWQQDATCDVTNTDATVTCNSNSFIRIGQLVVGTGIPNDTVVASINIGIEGSNVTSFELSKVATATNANTTLSFLTSNEVYRGCKAVIIGRYNIENKGEWKADIGSVIDLGDTTPMLNAGTGVVNEWTFFYSKTQQKKFTGSTVHTFDGSTFTDSTCDYNNDPTITHDANANIIKGLFVSGTGIPANAIIGTITDSTHFELADATTGSALSTTGGSVTNGTLTFTTDDRTVNFAETKIDGTAISAASTDSIADGIHFVLKPLLHVGANIGCSVTRTHANVHNPGVGSDGVIKTLEFDMSVAGNSDNHWLQYSPNLTGCYLVSTEAYQTYSSTLNSADSGGFEGTWTDSTVGDIGKSAAVSMEGTHPYKMHYILSHTVKTNGNGTIHYLTVDNADINSDGSTVMSQFYRVMQPAETCIWPNTPSQIDLYKMSSGYTKRPDSDEMFGDVGHINLWENGYVKGKKDEHGYNEAVQSMYVLVDMDNTESDAEFIVPRTHSTVFGDDKRFEPDTSYDVLLHDGNSKHRKNMTVQTATTNDCRLKFSDEFEKMAGIVSIGEIFTVHTPTPNKIRRPETANIASSVSICQEAEQIVNDLLETENITYTDTTTEFPYFIAPDFRGIELYSAIEFLANFKNKRIVVTPDGIRLRPDTETFDYNDIELNSKNDIHIIEITKNESLFDHFNEVSVYGSGFKSIRRDRKSINKRGKKSLEEVDETLRTQQEVNERAISLLRFHSEDNYRITIQCSGSGLELISAGDIITLDFPEHRIAKGKYLVLELKHTMYGMVELEVGRYNKGLSERFAEIIQTQKKTSAFARANKFKTQTDTTDFFESFALKELRFIIRKTSKTSNPFTIGFNYAIDTLTTGGTNTGAPIGFNTSLGSVSTTTELDEDLV